MAKHSLTDRFCRDLPHPETGQSLYFDGHPDAPRGFALRVTSGAKSWIVNYYVGGRQKRLTLPVQFPEWGPKRARIEASKVKTAVHAGADPLAEREAKRTEAKARIVAERAQLEFTLGALLNAYVEQLEKVGKHDSARAVRSTVRKNIELAHPDLFSTPAAEVEPEDAVTILSPVLVAGKARTAGRLRSYMRAAYSAAVRARLDPAGAPALRMFKLRTNPLAEVAAITAGNNARERALSLAELRAYWQRAQHDPVLALHLLSGAQRIEQLARCTLADLDRDTMTLRLLDPKGRRTTPRRHVVPMLPEAIATIDASATPKRRGDYVFTATDGRTGCRYDGFRARLAPVVATMCEVGETTSAFTPGDLRRTVETRLAAVGVPLEVRAHLQSHGLGGVQQRHYDKHGYLDEKRDALKKLYVIMTGEPATVTLIARKRKAAK